ncbi:methylated-DNA--[protein]-cysteine S-methyltransferase [Luethyella okanaganae]|uniref:Methylated-DNA--protein-cysteine methyltransferase n=1 Tax=Luethyella okanaganae TaxID=69372 RepID=A0ABW1VH04_9MICO
MTSNAAYLIRTESPIGPLELTSDGEHITSLSIAREGRLPLEEQPQHPVPVLEEAVRQLSEYFAGTRRDFDLPLKPEGTAFQRDVWARLGELGWGEYISYGELGLGIGKPGSARAIGGAVGANPLPIIIGCHRVLAGDKRLTGYSGGNGIPTKVWLLDHEGIQHRGARESARLTSASGSTPLLEFPQ